MNESDFYKNLKIEITDEQTDGKRKEKWQGSTEPQYSGKFGRNQPTNSLRASPKTVIDEQDYECTSEHGSR